MAKIADNKEYFQHNFDKILLNSSSVNGVEFEDCHFNECDFSQAIYLECKFINCTFQRCNLSLLKISGSTFTEVEFLECKLVGIDWTLATWSDFNIEPELVFKKCLLNDGSFFGLSLHKLTFDGCKLHDVDFREGDFNGSIMTDCDFSYSLFMKTNLIYCCYKNNNNHLNYVFNI